MSVERIFSLWENLELRVTVKKIRACPFKIKIDFFLAGRLVCAFKVPVR